MVCTGCRCAPATPAVATSVNGIEYAICGPSAALQERLSTVFPASGPEALTVVPTCQRAAFDLSRPAGAAGGAAAEAEEEERARLRANFEAWAVAVAGRLSSAGYWADYADAQGLPVMHKTTRVPYPEAEGLALLLGYKTAPAGAGGRGAPKAALHPAWGGAVYPATLFARAPAAAVAEAIRGAEAQLAALH